MRLTERLKQWENDVRQRAWQESLLEGKNEGIREGESLLLQRQLIRRFGTLPKEVEERLRLASLDELDAWGERVLDANRLEEVFEEEIGSS